MKLLLIAVLTCLPLMGCKSSISGDLRVKEPLVLNTKDGDRVTLRAGQYNAKLKSQDRDELRFKVDIQDGDDQTVVLKTEDFQIPQNGIVTLTSEQSGQPWNVVAVVDTDMTVSPTYRTYESCGSNQAYWRCSMSADYRYCNYWYDDYYYDGFGPYYASREVVYHEEDTTRKVDLSFKDSTDNRVLATFNGERTHSTDIIYDYIGTCY